MTVPIRDNDESVDAPDTSGGTAGTSRGVGELINRQVVMAWSGLLATLLSLLILVLFIRTGELQQIPAVLGPVLATIGTLTGTAAGHAAGASGKQQLERQVRTYEANLQPEQIREIHTSYPKTFPEEDVIQR
jgi:hypothetical protein